ncbi:MAG: aspartate carbamoyltransferase regulatory subunit, partial [Clostridia bacterium]|nr:aspartate carbamoyltransferase regulatory subunit [Clostridia bacterium]
MIIGQIKDGIVLDHISAGRGMEIYKVLGLDKLDCTVAMIKNADSVKKGKKDIIKVGQVIDLDFDVLGYIDPGITVNIIQDGKLAKRSHLSLPERVKGIIRCKNP